MRTSKISLKVRRELVRLKKEEHVRVPHAALKLAETMGKEIRRMASSITEAAELCIDFANNASV